MKHYDYIFFDLDGTLTDSGPGIINAVEYALNRFGITVPDRAALRRFIGPPLVASFQRYYGFSEADAKEAQRLYRVYFSDRGIFENSVYPGIPALLKRLLADGRRLVMATGKPEPYTLRIAERFDLEKYFAFIAGATMDETRNTKAAIIRYALDACCIRDPGTVLMVGDREHDVLGAKQCGVACLGVLYGYGTREELEAAGAACIAETVEDVGSLLLGATN